ncbi:MAG: GerMN domain-containing protein [Clostridia bacterium]|nr:GerMN domain-containing protein [Clostridia bacterium]
MKKRLFIAAVIFIAAALIAGLVFLLKPDEDKLSAVLYFLNDEETELIADNNYIPVTDANEIPLQVINLLRDNRAAGGKKSPVPKDCTVNTITFESEDRISIDMSAEFLCDNPHKNVMRAYAVIKSVCSAAQYYGVKEVRVTVNNSPIKAVDGGELDFLSDSDISRRDEKHEILTYDCMLYYEDKASGTLRAEQRSIDAGADSIEQNIVNALIKGPVSKELKRTLPSDMVLISAQTVDGICFVNLEPVSGISNSGTAVLSIVKTLVQLDNVDSVQLLIDGKKVDEIGGIDVSEPIK